MKIAFVDIDGTLLPIGSVKIPDSSIEAIHKARKNGNLVFINSGRCRLEIGDSITNIGFDGLVCSNGLYVEEHGEVLRNVCMDENLVKQASDWLEERKIGFFFEGQRVMCASGSFYPQLLEREGPEHVEGMKRAFPMIKESELYYKDIAKINFLTVQGLTDKMRNAFGAVALVNEWSTVGDKFSMGEITVPNASKADGIKLLLEKHGLDRSCSLAFGDSSGDIAMVKYSGVGVAMGNASDSLKEVADYVTDDINEDGLYNAFRHFGLI